MANSNNGPDSWRLDLWQVVIIDCLAPGFGPGEYVRIGAGHHKPGETQQAALNRLAVEFDRPPERLRLSVSAL